MKKITFTPVFNLKKKLNKNGEAVITIRAYQNESTPTYKTTDLYVKPKQWDKRRLAIKNHPNEDIYNQQILDRIKE